MNALSVLPRCDETGVAPIDPDRAVINLSTEGTAVRIASLAKGTIEGRASVAIVFDLPNGHQVLVETTLRLFLTAALTLAAAHEHEAREIGWPA